MARRSRNGATLDGNRLRRSKNAEAVVQTTRLEQPEARQPEPSQPEKRQPEPPVRAEKLPEPDSKPSMSLFCYEEADSAVGRYLANLAGALARRDLAVHLFSRVEFPAIEGVERHTVGVTEEGTILEQVQDFANRAFNAFLRRFPPGSRGIAAIGHEWTTAPVLSLLQSIRNLQTILAVQSLERQRSDMTSDLSKQIEEIEFAGLRQASKVLFHDGATAEVAKFWVPESAERSACTRPMFLPSKPAADFDAGAVKARYQIGPIDPTILYVGDFSEAYGPDLLMKAMPAILKNNKQARAVFVGDGALYWTLRVYSRYLLLDHAVRMPGSVEGQEMQELIQAADVIVVPSRESTPWWPILSGWAAGRPLVVSHNAAPGLVEHEKDGVLIYPSESSCTWGVERILFDPALGQRMGTQALEKLEQRFGWASQAEQILEMVAQPAER
jgi:glycosyltransferase involved in cell wall biosynthesis